MLLLLKSMNWTKFWLLMVLSKWFTADSVPPPPRLLVEGKQNSSLSFTLVARFSMRLPSRLAEWLKVKGSSCTRFCATGDWRMTHMSSGFGYAFVAGESDWIYFPLLTNSTLKGYFADCRASWWGIEMLKEDSVVLFELRFGVSIIGWVVGGSILAAIFISGVIFEVFAASPVYLIESPIGIDLAFVVTQAFSFLTLST